MLGLNDRIGAAGLNSTAIAGRKAFVLVGLVALTIVLWTASSAKADVATKGELREIPTVTSAPGEVKPFVSVENEDYECTAKYSDVQSGAFTWVIGNCPKGSTLEAVVRRAHTESEPENYSLGGWVTGTFQGCGWIENDKFKPKAKKIKPTTTCSEISSGKYEVAESSFMAKHNAGAGDGYFVVNKTACPEYANYRPWSTNNLEQEQLRTEPAYARQEPGSSYPALKWRYTTKYNSTDATGQYVMVRDVTLSAGEGNWVFVPRSCLPSTLPENDNERVPNPPAVTTNAASGVQTPNATLNGNVNPNGVATKYHFEYGTSPSFGLSTTEGNAGSGTGSVPESAALSGLAAGTTYYYRIAASSAAGSSSGGTQSFTTQPPPSASTAAASPVYQERAILNGTVNPHELDTHYYFQYGKTTGYGSSTSSVDAGAGTSTLAENATITGLQSNATYHYRIVASSSAGTSYGGDQAFETPRSSRPALITESGGGLETVWRGTDGNIYATHYVSGSWSTFSPTWERVGIPSGVTAVGNPVLTTEPGGGLEIIWRGTDGNVYATQYISGSWSTFSPTWGRVGIPSGVTVAGDPALTTESGGGLEIVWRGTDGNIYATHYVSGSWSTFSPTWERVGIPSGVTVSSDPVLTTESGGGLDIVWRGSDGNVYSTHYASGWTTFSPTWERVGIPSGVSAVGDPALITESGGGLDIVWRGSDGNVYSTHYASGWTTFSPTWERVGIPSGVTVSGDPALIKESGGGLEIVWHGSDGNIYSTHYASGWSTFSPTWERVGIPSGVTVGGDPMLTSELIVWRGSDGNIYDTRYSSGWSSFSPTWEKVGIPSGVTMDEYFN